MALPSSTYALLTYTNPTSDLTDYVGYVDLSLLSQTWWDAVTSSDGGRGRAGSEDGATEYATDWKNFDDVAQTGKVWFRKTGTLASSGVQKARIYPPQSGNTLYLPTATFGSDNVHVDSELLYHDGGGADSTANGNTGTAYYGAVVGDMTSPVGKATDFDGVEQGGTTGEHIKSDNLLGVTGATPRIISGWVKADAHTADAGAWHTGLSFQEHRDFSNEQKTGDGNYAINIWFDDANYALPADNFGWHLHHHYYDGATAYAYVDGVLQGSSTVAIDTADNNVFIGSKRTRNVGQVDPYGQWFNGSVGEFRVRTGNLSAEMIDLEYQNQNDPATFWTYETVEPGGAEVLELQKGAFSIAGKQGNLIRSLLFGADKSTFTLSGKDISLIRSLIQQADSGSLTLSGKAVSLLRDTLFQAEKGNYSVTGKQLELLYEIVLGLEKASFTITGKQVDFVVLSAASIELQKGSFTIQGKQAGLASQYLFGIGTGQFNIAGKELDLLLSLTLDKGQYSVSGKEAEFLYDSILVLEKGQFSIVGKDMEFQIPSGISLYLGDVPIQSVKLGSTDIAIK